MEIDELYARFLHLHKLVIDRPIGLYWWPDETAEYFEVRESIYGNGFVRSAVGSCGVGPLNQLDAPLETREVSYLAASALADKAIYAGVSPVRPQSRGATDF